MDSSHASTENVNKTDDGKNTENEMSISKLESMVTAEQVLSASVARKRRNITKRRSSAGKTRELTPARQLIDRTSTDEEAPQTRPKTPERRRRKVTKSNVSNPTNDVKNDASTQPENKTCAPVTDVTIQNGRKKADKRDSLVSISQAELLALFDKAKRKIVSSRDRYKKSGALPRSQSSPRQLTEEELLESFKRAQLITAEREKQRKRSHSARKYSTDSCKSTSSSEIIVFKPLRPIVQEFVAQRKLAKNHTFANKIVEILDPKTSKVIHTQEVLHVRFKFFDFVKVLRHFTIFELCREFQKFKSDRTDEWNKIKILRMRCLNELLMIMVVCGLGGVMFKFVEGTFENFYKCGVKRVKRDFIDNLWTKSHNLREEDWKSLARTKLRVFEEELHNAHEAGIHSYSGQRSWSFLNGVVYSLTVITTIGYGHLFPTTTTGQGLTIVYALIGIPLFLIILTDFGKLFTRCIKFVWSFVRRIYYTGSCRRARKTTHVGDIFKGAQIMYDIATMRRPSVFNPDPNPEEPSTQPEQEEVSPITPAPSNYEINDEFNLPITLALSILVLYIFLGAVAFQIMEGWDFFTSFYFVFISMSTIGFGDYVPRRHPTFMLVSIAYLVFGLALMSMCINVVQDKLSNTFKHASAKIGATIGLTVNEEDGSIITVPPDTVEMPEIHNVEVTNEVS